MIKNVLKTAVILLVTFSVFLLLKNMIGDIGGMPQSFKDAYQESIFIKKGLFIPAVILLMSVILLHMLWNFIYLQKNIMISYRFKGTLFGFFFGGLWFLGFLEMIFICNSNSLRHILSGIRDLTSLTVFGLMAGLFYTSKKTKNQTREKGETFAVIGYTSVFFALFHGIQFYLTYKPIGLQIDNVIDVIWLLLTGAWIGLMYYFLSPKLKNTMFKTLFFTANTFGINWLLYNSFYYLFLDQPVVDLLVRTIFDVTGVGIGLIIYERMSKVKKNVFSLGETA